MGIKKETKNKIVKWLIIIAGIIYVALSAYMAHKSEYEDDSDFEIRVTDNNLF